MRILVKDITVGQFVKVHRKAPEKAAKGQFVNSLTQTMGIICHIPRHRRFCTVQFFNQHTGKPIYKQSFFWPDIAVINRPENFKGNLPERVRT